MDITLTWTGPVGPGRFPDESEMLEAMQASGVYLRVKVYDGDLVVGYVGQSKNVLLRIDQHLMGLVSLQQTLRDETGKIVYLGDFSDRIAAYNDIGSAMALAAGDASRTRFYVAFCGETFDYDCLNLVEGALKDRMEEIAKMGAGLIDCENRQGVVVDPFDGVVRIGSDSSALDADHAEIVERLIGADAIEIAETVLGLGYAH